MTNTNRRTLVRGIAYTAWTAPVILSATKVPAFAASALICAPTAECKQPGEGSNTKDYLIRPNCTSVNGTVTTVRVYDDKDKRWIVALDQGDGSWLARGFNDSRRDRAVEITDSAQQVMVYTIAFPPC
jgi:hypothetical protein